MSAANVPMVIDQGADWAAHIVWTNSAEEPVNVVAPCRMDIKDGAGATVLSLSTPETELPPGVIPEITLSSDLGLIQIHIEDAVTAAIPAGLYAYDLFVSVDDGDEYAGMQINRLIAGRVTVNKRITKI